MLGLRLLTSLLLLNLSIAFAWADEQEQIPWYEIELILFENIDKEGQFTEQLPETIEFPNLENTIDLIAPDLVFEGEEHYTELPYQRLRDEQLQLGNVVRRIKRNRNYRFLLHLGWRQPGLAKDLAPNILIYPYQDRPIPTPFTDNNRSEPTLNSEPFGPYLPQSTWIEEQYILGKIKLILTRYLHVDANLYMVIPEAEQLKPEEENVALDNPESVVGPRIKEQPNEESTADAELIDSLLSTTQFYHLEETRRVKKEELHYFDHPRFGMILTVRDYVAPVEPEPEPLPEEVINETSPAATPNGGMIKRSN